MQIQVSYTEETYVFNSNSTPWGKVIRALRNKSIDAHLVDIIKSYLLNTRLLVGPTLWSLFYDGVLRLKVRRELNLIGLADDLAVDITARTPEQLAHVASHTIRGIVRWMHSNQLEITTEKTQAIVLVGRRKLKELSFSMNGIELNTVEKAKYLGVLINRNMLMVEHVILLESTTLNITRQLNMLMSSTKGPRSSSRKLLVAVIHSLILYAASIW